MDIQLYSKNKHHILYDAEQVPQITEQWFVPDWWQKEAQVSEPSGGRGQAFFIHRHAPQPDLVLRHYRRGGLVAKISADRYLFSGLEKSRAWQEFKLTQQLFESGLPVPRPIAAHIQRAGIFYQADLLTERLPDTQPFARYLNDHNELDDQQRQHLWQQVGKTIALFHRAGLNHSDLNANNILVNTHQQVWLIDFDRCQLQSPSPHWQQQNLARLQRSIVKLNQQAELPSLWSELEFTYNKHLVDN